MFYIQSTKIRKIAEIIKALFPSIIFCLKYLPFKQAIKLPILIYRPQFVRLKGKVSIECDKIYFGMIQLGFYRARPWPNNGIIWCVDGKVTFNGKATIGNNSSITVGRQGILTLGDDFHNTSGFKCICNCKISFGKSTRVGWNCVFMDTGLHPLKDVETGRKKRSFGPIEIGNYNWFGLECLIMHSVKTPERCIFAGRTTVTRGGDYQPYCVHGGSPVHVLSRNVYRDFGDDLITDYSLPDNAKR